MYLMAANIDDFQLSHSIFKIVFRGFRPFAPLSFWYQNYLCLASICCLVFNDLTLVSLLTRTKVHLQNEGTANSIQRTYHVKPICHPLKVDLFQCYYVHYASCGSVHRTMIGLHFFTFWGFSLCYCSVEMCSDACSMRKAYFSG